MLTLRGPRIKQPDDISTVMLCPNVSIINVLYKHFWKFDEHSYQHSISNSQLLINVWFSEALIFFVSE